MAGWLAALGAAAKAAAPVVKQAAPYALAIGQGYMDRRAQERAFEQNKQFWFERFEKEAQYNSPVEQKARMMAAGLNPALMYKGGQTGGNVSGGSAQGKIAERYQMTELAKMSAEVQRIRAETANIEADTGLKGQKGDLYSEQKAGLILDNAMKQIQYGEYSEQQKQITAKLTADALAATAQRQKLESEKANMDKQNAIMEKELQMYQKVYQNYLNLGMDPNSGVLQQIFQGLINLGTRLYGVYNDPNFVKPSESLNF